MTREPANTADLLCSGSNPGLDLVDFQGDNYPTSARKVVRVSDTAYIRFKTIEDQAACIVTVAADSDDVHGVTIDASRCEHESRLLFAMPRNTELLTRSSSGTVVTINYSVSVQCLRLGEPPFREISLFEYDEEGVLQRVHRLRKRPPVAEHNTTITIPHAYIREHKDVGHYEFGIRIAPHATPFRVAGGEARFESMKTAGFEVTQYGRRIQGKMPNDACDAAKLVISCVESSTTVPLINEAQQFVPGLGCLEFDLSAVRVASLAHHDMLSGGEVLVCLAVGHEFLAGSRCVLPSPASEHSVAGANFGATNAELLKSAQDELRESRNLAGLFILDQLTELSPVETRRAARLRMRALLNLRRFEEAVRVFDLADAPLQNDVKFRSRYIEACANLRDNERVGAELEKVFFLRDANSAETLGQLYKFTPFLSDTYTALYRERIRAARADLRQQLKSLMRCSHDFLRCKDWRAFFDVMSTIDSFDLSNEERACVSLLNAQLAHELVHVDKFIEALNGALSLSKVAPVALINSRAGFLLSNVTGESVSRTDEGPLISVLMTSFNSEATVTYAINSILAQSYTNLELFVVDDCSGDRSRDIIANMANRDPRIIPIFASANVGTYVCRNMALVRARGEYITCQDSDDWAHPKKIETSVRRLAGDPSLVATGVQHVRLSPTEGIQFRSDYIRPDASSLMFRADPIRRSLGFYDSIRASGDSEFQRRMELTFGAEAVRYGRELLSLVLWSPNTLSGGGAFSIDDDSGVSTPVRNEYRREFVKWHENADRLFVPFPMAERLFPAPEPLLSMASKRDRKPL